MTSSDSLPDRDVPDRDVPHRDVPDRGELRQRLTPIQYEVTQNKGTERPFSGEFFDCDDEGVYRCIVCNEPLFTSESKFNAGCGWPSFDQPVESAKVAEHLDRSAGMVRTEVTCDSCGAHLGHVFPDGPPQTTGLRYCINSAALRLERTE